MKKFLAGLFLLLLFTNVYAEEKFWTKKQVIGTTVNFLVRSADTGITCRNLTSGGIEYTLPTQSCGGAIGWNLVGGVGGEILSSYILHRTHHEKLQTINPYVWAGTSAEGAAYSLEHR